MATKATHTHFTSDKKVTHTQTLLHSKAGVAGRIGLRGGRRRALTQWGSTTLHYGVDRKAPESTCLEIAYVRLRVSRRRTVKHAVDPRLAGVIIGGEKQTNGNPRCAARA